MKNDPALQALWLPLDSGRIALPNVDKPANPGLFLNARAPLPANGRSLACVQPFRPDFDALVRAGAEAHGDDDGIAAGSQPLVLLLASRARAWNRALLARAAVLCASDGQIVASASNDEGAKSLEADFMRLFGGGNVLSKHKCRVVWASPRSVDHAIADEWLRAAEPRRRDDGLWTQAGVFSADGIDPASALLMMHLPANLAGTIADFGAGSGVLSRHVARHCQQARKIDLYEADHRALQLAKRNLGDANVDTAYHWHDIAAGVSERFDAVVMNPPFHLTGKRGIPELGQRFIDVAADALQRRGALWMVANAHLPYEEVLAKRFARVDAVATHAGFKVLHAAEPHR
ncbi:class I SAM-dependent methyltransferase [Solilutibacter silvestris]|uniref:16S RNA G1207 methylase RsmC n=1 Tax=Solilutibacter silvestris TaxID=1645665 RepID=A0A2K1Q1Q6_9GAMM|nr:class I SAM-dependent methyltransferase [Lysobacter silvestris]PNS08988.1 16S RNA G1207 methylase RsmC [Lysobacter silvestris]